MTALLDADEVARRLNVSRATAYREMRKMLHVVVGRRSLRVSEVALEAYLRRHSSSPPGAAAPERNLKGGIVRMIHPRTKPLAAQAANDSEAGPRETLELPTRASALNEG